jgi:hypothetical protein
MKEMNMASKSKLDMAREEISKNSKIKPIKKRKKRTMTSEQKAALVERLEKARAARGPTKNLSIHESIRDLPEDHPLHHKKVKDWIKDQKGLLQGLKDFKDSKDAGLRKQYWDAETYLFNLQKYLSDGVYLDNRYGSEKQSKIRLNSVAMAYYPDGTPKRTPGIFYPDMGCEYTNEMAAEDHARSKKISNKK